jgi:hypothetical protein
MYTSNNFSWLCCFLQRQNDTGEDRQRPQRVNFVGIPFWRDYRGSRSARGESTTMNDTTPTIGPIRGIKPQVSYWQSTVTQQRYTRIEMCYNSVEQVPGNRRCERGGTILFLGKQYCRTYRIQGRDLSLKEGKFFLYWSPGRSSVRNGFWEIPLDSRCFPNREPVLLMMWTCPLSRHNRHKKRVRIGTVCIWEKILCQYSRWCGYVPQ